MCVAFSNREGRYLAAGHEDGKVTVWDVGSGKICQSFHGKDYDEVITCDLQSVLICYQLTLVRYDRYAGRLITVLCFLHLMIRKCKYTTRKPLRKVSISIILILRRIRGKLIASINAHSAWAVTVKFSPDELHFASG